MAITQFGVVITDMRGSIGGVTFSSNNFGTYAKLKRAPPRTPNELQSERRANFGYLTSYWANDLVGGERDAWDAYAVATTFYNSLSDPYTVTGFNMFLRTNTLRVLSGEAIIDAAPGTGGHGAALTIDSGQLNATSGTNKYAFMEEAFPNWTKTTTDDTIFIYGIPQIPPTGTTKRAPKRYMDSIIGNAGSPPEFPHFIDYPFGKLAAGNLAVIIFRRMDENGKISAFTVKSTTIE